MAEMHFTPIETLSRAENLYGKTFARLTCIAPVSRGADGRIKWLCSCSCGNWKIVIPKHLKTGHTQSCGCYRIELHTTHGMGRTEDMNPTHRSWLSMRSRCTRPSEPAYKHYGGRGITVCDRWQKFENFLTDIGERPNREYSIDRIDVNGNYEPSNCRWATRAVQNRNRRNNVLVNIDGETKCLKDWLKHYGKSSHTYYKRIKEGRTPEQALADITHKPATALSSSALE